MTYSPRLKAGDSGIITNLACWNSRSHEFSPIAAAFGAGAIALQCHNAVRQDKNEYTLAEEKAYDDYLYPKHQGYMSIQDMERKKFAKENQAEIDQVKKEIKKEEEEEDQGS